MLGRVGAGQLRALEAAHDAGEPMDPTQLWAWFGTVATLTKQYLMEVGHGLPKEHVIREGDVEDDLIIRNRRALQQAAEDAVFIRALDMHLEANPNADPYEFLAEWGRQRKSEHRCGTCNSTRQNQPTRWELVGHLMQGKNMRLVAGIYGVNPSTVARWCGKYGRPKPPRGRPRKGGMPPAWPRTGAGSGRPPRATDTIQPRCGRGPRTGVIRVQSTAPGRVRNWPRSCNGQVQGVRFHYHPIGGDPEGGLAGLHTSGPESTRRGLRVGHSLPHPRGLKRDGLIPDGGVLEPTILRFPHLHRGPPGL